MQGTDLDAPVTIRGAGGQPLWRLAEIEGRPVIEMYHGGQVIAQAGIGGGGEAELILYHQGRPAAGLHATPQDGGVVTAFAPNGAPYAALLGTGPGVEVTNQH